MIWVRIERVRSSPVLASYTTKWRPARTIRLNSSRVT
jgi:hypothetical protein